MKSGTKLAMLFVFLSQIANAGVDFSRTYYKYICKQNGEEELKELILEFETAVFPGVGRGKVAREVKTGKVVYSSRRGEENLVIYNFYKLGSRCSIEELKVDEALITGGRPMRNGHLGGIVKYYFAGHCGVGSDFYVCYLRE